MSRNSMFTHNKKYIGQEVTLIGTAWTDPHSTWVRGGKTVQERCFGGKPVGRVTCIDRSGLFIISGLAGQVESSWYGYTPEGEIGPKFNRHCRELVANPGFEVSLEEWA